MEELNISNGATLNEFLMDLLQFSLENDTNEMSVNFVIGDTEINLDITLDAIKIEK